ncbi:UPF0702 transmembrane protein YetF [Halobacillus andaensis]|uniref:UPF0702 transmembrane protein YetF n=1 Tax=Halobacillus andaensis TaxID=1176239 RepID=A0A917B1R9_HALAA|nr:DUF421 domain-containing protein [Halobacillus andaensis]MBP2004029.1 uncharacterized membrane protein YcaP (DUF421 family) [Halobacillus andaensis]GGF15253.1 UPF0702 transmembrane protein YetF [Halobacillus andaensis]
MEYMRIGVELIFGFFALFALTKLLGKSQITQITAFDFISAVILGELVGNALYDKEVGVLQVGFAVFLWAILLYITELMTEKFKGSRKFLEGRPSIIINQGQIDREQMKNNKLDINQLQHLLRTKDVFSLQEVQFAVLETDGTISVMRKSQVETITREDMNLPPQQVALPRVLISDGEVLWDNLTELGLDKTWLEAELYTQNFSGIQEVFIAEYTPGEQLFVMGYEQPTR